MDHRFGAVFLEHCAHRRRIGHIALNQRPPAHRVAMSGAKVVDDYRFEPKFCEVFCGVATNVAGPACNYDGQREAYQMKQPRGQ